MPDYILTARYGTNKTFRTALYTHVKSPDQVDIETLVDPDERSELFEREWYSDWTVSCSDGGECTVRSIYVNDAEISLETSQPFLLQYGFVQFRVTVEAHGSAVVLSSKYCSAMNSTDSGNIRQMIQRISDIKDPVLNLLRWPSRSPEEDFQQQAKNPEKYSMISGNISSGESRSSGSATREIVALYSKYAGFFRARPEFTVQKRTVPAPYHRVKLLSRDSMMWSVRTGNMHRIPSPSQSGGIMINGSSYLPAETLTETTVKDYQIYENQVIIGFLDTVVRQLSEEAWIRRKGCHGDIDFTGFDILRMILYPENVPQQDSLPQIQSIRRQYQQSLRIEERNIPRLLSPPVQTKRFQEIQPYHEIYQKIYEWFRKESSWNLGAGAIFKGHLADKLYEYYCWQELLQLFSQKGYGKEKASVRTNYSGNRPKPPFSNIVFLKNGQTHITLYYDPWIPICKNDAQPQHGISLVRTDLSSLLKNSRGYSPDFLIKVEKDRRVCYAVLDAKFRDMKHLFAAGKPADAPICAMEEALQKYYIKLSDRERLDRPIKMVWLLQGRSDSEGTNSQVIEKGDREATLAYYPESFFKNLSWGAISLNSQNSSEWAQHFWNVFRTAMLDSDC